MGGKQIAAFAAVAFVLGTQPARAAELDLERTSATELAQKLAAREITSAELTKAYIDRIAAVNRRGPAINTPSAR
jgi:amidase